MTAIYQEYRPPSRLAEQIECFWSLDAMAVTRQLVVPDGCMDILVRMNGAVYAVDVIGSMTRTEHVSIRSGHTYLGARFKPGRLSQVAPVDCSKIVNGSEPLQNALNVCVSVFADRIGQASSAEEKVEQFERALSVRSDPLMGQRALEALVAKDGNVSAVELSDIAGLSERQLRRQIIQLTGLPPKAMARVLRFRKAVSLLQARPALGFAGVALDCGYSDQAHFSHDFAEFAGCSPSSFVKSNC